MRVGAIGAAAALRIRVGKANYARATGLRPSRSRAKRRRAKKAATMRKLRAEGRAS